MQIHWLPEAGGGSAERLKHRNLGVMEMAKLDYGDGYTTRYIH